eukprot:gene15849-13250_t
MARARPGPHNEWRDKKERKRLRARWGAQCMRGTTCDFCREHLATSACWFCTPLKEQYRWAPPADAAPAPPPALRAPSASSQRRRVQFAAGCSGFEVAPSHSPRSAAAHTALPPSPRTPLVAETEATARYGTLACESIARCSLNLTSDTLAEAAGRQRIAADWRRIAAESLRYGTARYGTLACESFVRWSLSLTSDTLAEAAGRQRIAADWRRIAAGSLLLTSPEMNCDLYVVQGMMLVYPATNSFNYKISPGRARVMSLAHTHASEGTPSNASGGGSLVTAGVTTCYAGGGSPVSTGPTTQAYGGVQQRSPAGSITSHRGDGPPDSFFVSSYHLWILIFVALTVADMPHTPNMQLQWIIAAAGIPVTLTSYHQWPIIFVALWFLPTECWNVLMHIMYGNSSSWWARERRESSAFDAIRGRSRGRSRGRRARSRSGDRADGGDPVNWGIPVVPTGDGDHWDGRRRSREESREQHGRWGRRAASVASSVPEYDPRNDGPDWEVMDAPLRSRIRFDISGGDMVCTQGRHSTSRPRSDPDPEDRRIEHVGFEERRRRRGATPAHRHVPPPPRDPPARRDPPYGPPPPMLTMADAA